MLPLPLDDTGFVTYYHQTIIIMKNDNSITYLEILIDLGLRPQEAKVYLACLKLGQATVGKIALEAEVQRTFVYDILEDLHDKGLVSWVLLRGKKYFRAISAEQLKKIQEQKFRKFESIIPELKAIESTVGDRPKVSFYEGGEGIQLALLDTLNQPVGGEILAYATAEGYYSTEPEFTKEYLKKRVKKKIFCRAIGPDTEVNREYVVHDKEQMRETRLVSGKEFPFSNEIDIYGSKVAIMSLQGELLAVVIESESVAKTQRMIFELAWRGAQSF